jgi:hypothetical protein
MWSASKRFARDQVVVNLLLALAAGVLAVIQGGITWAVLIPLAVLGVLWIVVSVLELLRAPVRAAEAARVRHQNDLRELRGEIEAVRTELAKVTAPLAGGEFHNQRLRLADIARDLSNGEPIVSGRRFEDCTIEGPGFVTMVGDGGSLDHCTWEGTVDRLFVTVPDKAVVIGVVGFLGCDFVRCRFEGIGVMGPAAFKEAFAKGMSYEGAG